MNRAIAIACLGLGLIVTPLVVGNASSADAPATRIGVINLEKTLYETAAGKRANAAFEKTRTAKQAQLDTRQKQLAKYKDDLAKQASVLKPDVLRAKQEELQKNLVETQQLYLQLERDLTGERAKLVQDLLTKAQPLIADLAKAENLDIVLDQGAVVFATPAVDLTAKLNAKMK